MRQFCATGLWSCGANSSFFHFRQFNQQNRAPARAQRQRVVWEEGAKSRIRVDAGRERYNPLTGLWIGIIASLPNIILGVLTAVGFFLGNPEGFLGWSFAAKLSDITGAIAFLWQGMYIGIIRYIFPTSTYIYLAVQIPVILGCFASYWMGLRQWRLIKQKKKTADKK